MTHSIYYTSPLGTIMLASDGKNLTGLWFEDQKYFASTINQKENIHTPNLTIFDVTREWLDKYFKGSKPSITDLPLNPHGGEFRQQVWRILCGIPYGKVATYGNIAKEIAVIMNRKSMSAQAIGGAVGHNPISIIIPCHRVVGTDGSLTGYAGGINKKIQLLELEGTDLSGLSIPNKGSAL